MDIFCRLICAALFLAATVPPAIACTLGESEQKARQLISDMVAMENFDAAKAAAAGKKFNQVMNASLSSSLNPRAATEALCRALDEIAADLRR